MYGGNDMKPLHVGLLIAAGAIGGAVLMKISERPPAAPMTAQTQAPPATAPAVTPPPVTQVPATGVAEEPHPSAFESPKTTREAPKPGRSHHTTAAKSAPPLLAQSEPAPPPPAPVVATPPPADPAPAPQPVPPAPAEPENVTPPPPPAPPEPHRVTLNAGTLIPVRLVDGLTAERNLPGDSFMATLDKELVVDGFVIAERGARVEGRVVSADRGGRVKGVSTLEVELVRMHLADGQAVSLQTEGFERRAQPTRNEDAAKVGGGAALGAIIGAIAGGGKGAAIGAGVGGAAGAGDVMVTRGKPATLPSETRVTFRLRNPVTITEKLRA
jgi:hypothetical protein